MNLESLTQLKMFVGGERVSAFDGEVIESFQPSNGLRWAVLPAGGKSDVDRAVAVARQSFLRGDWSRATTSSRAKVFLELAELMSQEDVEQKMAAIETREWGRISAEARTVVKSFIETLRFFAYGASVHVDASRELEAASLLNFEKWVPLGVVGAILPWNSPLTLAGYKIIPALLMGNSVVVKPSELSSAPVLELAELLIQAGLPPGVLNVVTGDARTGEYLATHPDIAKITFTGSLEVGTQVYRHAAENMIPAMFELGGKSANIIFSDADLERATTAALTVFRNAGQACIAPSRLLVESSVYEEVVEQMVRKTKALFVGDPWDPKTNVGPVRTPRQLQKIMTHIDRAKKEGSRLLVGGGRPELSRALSGGWYVEPTIFSDVQRGTALEQEEVFGPVLAIIKVCNEEEAISIANGTKYGLAAAAWTRDFARAHRMAQRLEAGTVWINTCYKLSPRVPFGGIKKSGIGRECSLNAFREFSDIKNVVMELS
jgi:(Z)-2-((N-methylformamido)methylene)-5-hydroxybutyrolactone dehydrogenase